MSSPTQADYKIQTMLIRGIHSFFPKLRIVGEETTEYSGTIELDPHSITLDNYPKEIEQNESVPV
jgi:3'-phosphoadenosine 5'-phosphosulfate (PAPS) 3'-phosphatase